MYTSGVWVVRKGREEEFARHWQETADHGALEFPGVTFRLLRDAQDPRRFMSVSGAWRNAEQIQAARSSPSFQASMAAIESIVESSEVSIFELVAEVS